MLAQLENAIQELKAQKDQLLKEIEASGWKDDRPTKRIPEKREETSTWGGELLDTIVTVTPEQSPLPRDAALIYQQWYSAARTILAKNQPSRLTEFDGAYSSSGKGASPGVKQLIEGKYVTKPDQFRLMDLVNTQFEMLAAVPAHLRFSIYDIELTAYSILMDDEIAAARHLLSRGFLRSAGAIAGVVLERHLKNLLRKHTPPIKYTDKATLGQLNQLCKETVYDNITWSKVEHLTRLRNLCDHDKDREPSKDEARELIDGVSTIVKTQII